MGECVSLRGGALCPQRDCVVVLQLEVAPQWWRRLVSHRPRTRFVVVSVFDPRAVCVGVGDK